jgi:hypothetical protein
VISHAVQSSNLNKYQDGDGNLCKVLVASLAALVFILYIEILTTTSITSFFIIVESLEH